MIISWASTSVKERASHIKNIEKVASMEGTIRDWWESEYIYAEKRTSVTSVPTARKGDINEEQKSKEEKSIICYQISEK